MSMYVTFIYLFRTYYFQATVATGGGIWLSVSTCGGIIDIEVLARGKRLHAVKNVG